MYVYICVCMYVTQACRAPCRQLVFVRAGGCTSFIKGSLPLRRGVLLVFGNCARVQLFQENRKKEDKGTVMVQVEQRRDNQPATPKHIRDGPTRTVTHAGDRARTEADMKHTLGGGAENRRWANPTVMASQHHREQRFSFENMYFCTQ